MIERLGSSQESGSVEIQHHWAELIKSAFDRNDTEQLNSILIACEDNKILAKRFSWLIEPIELNSPKAKKMKEEYLESQELLATLNHQTLLDPPPAERIVELIDEFEAGDTSAWWRLNMDMTLRPDSTRYGDELESDLTSLPGWDEANVTTRSRIIAAAKRYLLEGEPETKCWLGTNNLHRPAFAGYRAFQLILQEEAEYISTIPGYIWEKWAPIILSYSVSNTTENYKTQKELVNKAYHYAPDEIIKTLIILIDKENNTNGHIFVIDKVEDCWDEKLAKSVSNKVKDNSMKPECMGTLLKVLLNHNVKEAEMFAISLLLSFQKSHHRGVNCSNFFELSIFQGFSEFWNSLIEECEKERSKAIIAASLLLNHPNEANWMVLWRLIEGDTDFGRDVITKIANNHRFNGIIKKHGFTEDQLADLYTWLFKHYPPSEDPIHDDGYTVEVRDNIAELRDAILRHLKERGKPEAIEAIKRIYRELPEQDWLRWTIMEAQDITHRETWMPPKPEHIFRMTRNLQVRLVESGDQLQDVLIESLKRLEEKLQGETPAVNDLWNEISNGRKSIYTPKDENRFSDYVKRHLISDLENLNIVANREVEIRRGEKPTKGERVDIRVDAIFKNSRVDSCDSITVIIEAKCCWNPKLDTDMKEQLVDRYLKDNRCRHGIYLVGWFNCDQWDREYFKKKRPQKIDIKDARQKFEAQAAELSNQNQRIRAFVMNTALR